jgi:hypothetical protein
LQTCQIWASLAFGDGPSSEVTQRFHYDTAHPHFIKFFVYLTDVDSDNGPHCVVPTSHRPDIAGWKLRFVTVRISDEQIERVYPGMTRELVGPKGTVIAAADAGLSVCPRALLRERRGGQRDSRIGASAARAHVVQPIV